MALSRVCVALYLVVLPLVVAQAPLWPSQLTQSLLNTPGYAQHLFETKSTHPGRNVGTLTSEAKYGYWAVQAPAAGSTITDAVAGFCLDLDHTLDNKVYNSTWANVADINDLIAGLQKIAFDEPGYASHCNETLDDFIQQRSLVLDASVQLANGSVLVPADGNIVNLAAQAAATANWCDVLRIVKYRGALLWIMNNKNVFQGKTASAYGFTTDAGACGTGIIEYGDTQRAIWHLVENRVSTNGIRTASRDDCYKAIVQKALQNNAYMPKCPAGQATHTVTTPLVVKPNQCEDNISGGCRQYLLIDHQYTIQCSTPPSQVSDLSGYVLKNTDCSAGPVSPAGNGLAGVSVKVCQCAAPTSCKFTSTDALGKYQFTFTEAESSLCWNIIEDGNPVNYQAPSTVPGSCGGVTQGTTGVDSTIGAVTPGVGSTCSNFNFVHCPERFLDFVDTFNISGYVYVDNDCNSAKGSSEHGIAGVLIHACLCADAEEGYEGPVAENKCSTVTTNAQGFYQFSGLEDPSSVGPYCIFEVNDTSTQNWPDMSLQLGTCSSTDLSGSTGSVGMDLFPLAFNGMDRESGWNCVDYNFGHCPVAPTPFCVGVDCATGADRLGFTACTTQTAQASARTTGTTVKLCFDQGTCTSQ